jgi:death-on-curing protein
LPSGRRHYRISWPDAVSAHNRALLTGGCEGIWSRDLILSAIGRPYSGYHRSLAEKSAALFHSVAADHGFVDGNKRTAVILTSVLIDRSGYRLLPRPGEDLEQAIEALAVSVVCKEIDFEQLVDWFQARLRSIV